ncbi:MAG: amidoligase family protein [Bacilli bacterium]|nr:amidoligase family protein [Bacilli bacterium]
MNEQELHALLDYLKNLNLTYRKELNVSSDINFGLDMQFLGSSIKVMERCIKDVNKSTNFINNSKYALTFNKSLYSVFKDKSEIEFNTPIFNNSKEFFEDFKNLLVIFQDNGLVYSINKGIHIHVDLSVFEKDSISLSNFLKLYSVYENIIFRFGYGEQEASNSNIHMFSKPSGQLIHNFIPNMSYSFDENIKNIRQILTCKSYSLNFHTHDNIVKNDTIEFRMFNNTFNPIIIQNYISMVGNMIDSIVNKRIDLDVLDYVYSQSINAKTINQYSEIDYNNALEFSDLIFSHSIDKDYFLKQYFIKEDKKIKKLVI